MCQSAELELTGTGCGGIAHSVEDVSIWKILNIQNHKSLVMIEIGGMS